VVIDRIDQSDGMVMTEAHPRARGSRCCPEVRRLVLLGLWLLPAAAGFASPHPSPVVIGRIDQLNGAVLIFPFGRPGG